MKFTWMNIFLIYILTIYRGCILFQLFSRGMRMHIPILTGTQKGHIRGLKNGPSLLKNVLLGINFQEKSHLYANFMYYILTIYHKWLLLQLLGCGIRMHIPILTRAYEKGH